MTDLVTISAGGLTARIAPLGAELCSLTDADGREWMTDADPAFWTGHAPLLFPIVGALAEGTLRDGEQAHALPATVLRGARGSKRSSRAPIMSASA
jgi:galactose mutarotase-like enzyme